MKFASAAKAHHAISVRRRARRAIAGILSACTAAALLLASTGAPSSAAASRSSSAAPSAAAAPSVSGEAYVLYDVRSGMFLLGDDPDTPLSPASITKVMTVLLALEHLDLTGTITVTRAMYETIPNDYMRLGLVDGEVIPVEEALYASLLISANDAAMALAIAVSGSVKDFVALMNQKAAELGCTHTNFTNPYGYADPKHLTTAHDMALIMAAALQYDLYTEISTTRYYQVPADNKSAEPRSIQNGDRFVTAKKFAYEYYIGGKTGYTDMSRYTIAAGARKDGRTLVGVILGASSSDPRYSDLISMFDYGFTAYETTRVDPADYDSARHDAIAAVTSRIAETGSSLTIAGTELKLNPFTTATCSQNASGYNGTVDLSPVANTEVSPEQVIVLPLYRHYGDGTEHPVGTLEISLAETAGTDSGDESSSAPEPVFGRILLILAILIFSAALLVILFFVLVILRRRKRRKRRLRPKSYPRDPRRKP